MTTLKINQENNLAFGDLVAVYCDSKNDADYKIGVLFEQNADTPKGLWDLWNSLSPNEQKYSPINIQGLRDLLFKKEKTK